MEAALDTATRIAQIIAQEIGARPNQVTATVELLDGGATVPFVARYRKEVTGGLDDTQLRTLNERLGYLRELEARRSTITETIKGQGKLTEELAKNIAKAVTKSELEDIYLPYKPKRRTKAMIARENGLEPLVEAILADRRADPEALAAGYVTEAVPSVKDALNGARDIIAEGAGGERKALGRSAHLHAARSVFGFARGGGGKRRRARNSPIISITASCGPKWRGIVLWRCCGPRMKAW